MPRLLLALPAALLLWGCTTSNSGTFTPPASASGGTGGVVVGSGGSSTGSTGGSSSGSSTGSTGSVLVGGRLDGLGFSAQSVGYAVALNGTTVNVFGSETPASCATLETGRGPGHLARMQVQAHAPITVPGTYSIDDGGALFVEVQSFADGGGATLSATSGQLQLTSGALGSSPLSGTFSVTTQGAVLNGDFTAQPCP